MTLGGKSRFGSEVLIGLGSLGESLSEENLLMALHGQRVTCQGQEESGGLATALTLREREGVRDGGGTRPLAWGILFSREIFTI